MIDEPSIQRHVISTVGERGIRAVDAPPKQSIRASTVCSDPGVVKDEGQVFCDEMTAINYEDVRT